MNWILNLFFAGLAMLSAGDVAADSCEEACQNQQLICEQEVDLEDCPRCRRKSAPRKRPQQNGFAEQQFQETGWPGRRGDELSDQLSR